MQTSSLGSWRAAERGRSATGGWYDTAIICRLPIEALRGGDNRGRGAGEVESPGPTLDFLRRLCVTCVSLSLLDRSAGPEFARFASAAHDHALRVLAEIDLTARHAGCPAGAGDEARFWLALGADGVVFPASRQAAGTCAKASRAPTRGDLDSLALNGVPVPCALHDIRARKLGAFRAQAVPTIAEAIRRKSSIPLSGLIVRLALHMASARLGVWAEEVERFDDVAQSRGRVAALARPAAIACDGGALPRICFASSFSRCPARR